MPTYVNDLEDIWTFARIVNPQQQAIIPSDVGSVTCTIYDLSATAYSGGTSPYVAKSTTVIAPVSSVIMPSLMTDYGWSQDNIGYNFRHRILNTFINNGTQAAKGGHTLKIEYVLNSTNNTSNQDWTKLVIVKYVTLAPVGSS